MNQVEKNMTRIFQTGTWNKGLTLIELIVVLFIISLATAIIIPSLWSTEKESLRSEAKHISSTLRYVYNETMSKKEKYLFEINLDTDMYGFSSNKESKDFRIKGDGGFKDIIIPSLGKLFEGEVIVEFGPLGTEEPIVIHLFSGDTEYTVIFNHITGRSKIIEGYSI
jgi:general secretion pathway protein H